MAGRKYLLWEREFQQTTKQYLQCDPIFVWQKKFSRKIHLRYQQCWSLVGRIMCVIFPFHFACIFWFSTVINMLWFYNKKKRKAQKKEIKVDNFFKERRYLGAISKEREQER